MKTPRVVIIGGGISGLAAAHKLCEQSRERQIPLHITLLEARQRVGGVIHTIRQNGFLMEGGPDSFISEKPAAFELCKRLGIEDEIIGTQNEFRRSFIFHNKKLVPIPAGFYLIASGRLQTLFHTPLLSLTGKLRMACDLFLPSKKSSEEESVAGFIRRRFGQEALECIGQPMFGGIYTADPEKLSLQATIPRFLEMEKRYGSVIKALKAREKESEEEKNASGPRYSLFLSFKGGIERLVEVLIEKIPEVEIRTSSAVSRIERHESWNVVLENQERIEADAVCIALPAPQTARLVSPFASDLSHLLASIDYESVATVNMIFRRKDIVHPLNGFGFVVPAVEKRKIIGCTFSSMKYPERAPENLVLLRAFVGGALQQEMFLLEDQAMQQIVQEELRDILDIQNPPLSSLISRYPNSMPQYHVGHLDKISSIEEMLKSYPGLCLTGNAYRGVGIPDCIYQAEKAAGQIFDFLNTPKAVLRNVNEF